MAHAPKSEIVTPPAARGEIGLVKALAVGVASQAMVAALAAAAAFSITRLPARKFLLPFVLVTWCSTVLVTGVFLAARERADPRKFALIMGLTFFAYFEALALAVIFALVWLGFETEKEALTSTLPFWVNAAALLSLILYLTARRRAKRQEADTAAASQHDRS